MRFSNGLRVILGVLAATALCSAPRAWATDPKDSALNARLRDAVTAAQGKIGALQPWEKKIFDQDLLPQYPRFVRNYRNEASGIAIDLDMDGIRNYLRFYAPKSLKREPAKIVVVLSPEAGCDRCREALAPMQKLVRERLEVRGFTPVWLEAHEVSTRVTGKAFDSKLGSIADQKGIPAWLAVQWQQAPVDDIDTAHADEKRYLVHSYLEVQDLGKAEGSLELLDAEPFEVSEGRLLTDAFGDLGARIAAAGGSAGSGVADGAAPELLVQISGIQSFVQMGRIRTKLLERLLSVSKETKIEDRKLARGVVTFALRLPKKPAELKGALNGLLIDPGVLAWVDDDPQTVRMEVR